MPVPDTVATCGDPAALSTMLTEPVRPPVAVGVKVMLMRQEFPGAMLVPQVEGGTVDDTAKSPVGVMEDTDRVPVPLFVNVKANATEVVDSVCWPKSCDVGV